MHYKRLRWQHAIASNPHGFQNLHPQIQAKILAKIQAAKQRQFAAETVVKQQFPQSYTNSSVTNNSSNQILSCNNNDSSPIMNSQYPENSNYFYSHTLNQIFHIQNNNMSNKNLFNAMRCVCVLKEFV